MKSKSGRNYKSCRHKFRPHNVMLREKVNIIFSLRKKKVY